MCIRKIGHIPSGGQIVKSHDIRGGGVSHNYKILFSYFAVGKHTRNSM